MTQQATQCFYPRGSAAFNDHPDKAEQQMSGADHAMIQALSFIACQLQSAPGIVG